MKSHASENRYTLAYGCVMDVLLARPVGSVTYECITLIFALLIIPRVTRLS